MLVKSLSAIYSFKFITFEIGKICWVLREKPNMNNLHSVLIKVSLKTRMCDDNYMFFYFRSVFLTGDERRQCVVRKRSPLSV
jgi:hypothetical protein